MKLSISNIGWQAGQDEAAYELMRKYGFTGLEIAPTRIFPDAPYARLPEAEAWAQELGKQYGFCVPSMQSIWFGRQEKIFGTAREREILTDYTKRAVDFAEAVGCKNLVFGCPRNRSLPEGADPETAIAFFREIGDYAAAHAAVIAMEANPPIYNTNYMNDTLSALELVERVDSGGFLLNLDVGTMIQNEERVEELTGRVHLINHVHISEPGLRPVERRELHKDVKKLLEKERYAGFVSVEMGKTEDFSRIETVMRYVTEVFGA